MKGRAAFDAKMDGGIASDRAIKEKKSIARRSISFLLSADFCRRTHIQCAMITTLINLGISGPTAGRVTMRRNRCCLDNHSRCLGSLNIILILLR